mgnify:CR=1 FL=1
MSLMLTKYDKMCVDMNEALKSGDKLAHKTISGIITKNINGLVTNSNEVSW